MSPQQPEKPRGAQPAADPRPIPDRSVPDLDAPPLTPEAEAKVKAGLGSTDETKGFTAN